MINATVGFPSQKASNAEALMFTFLFFCKQAVEQTVELPVITHIYIYNYLK